MCNSLVDHLIKALFNTFISHSLLQNMKPFIVLIVCLIPLISSKNPCSDVRCGKHMKCQPIKDETPPNVCRTTDLAKCVCQKGFSQQVPNSCCQRKPPTNNGTCAGVKCKPNAVCSECSSACQPTCSVPEPPMCTDQCVVGCQCVSGYILDVPNGRCIRQSQCRRLSSCPTNETCSKCANECGRRCDDYYKNTLCTMECRHQCTCINDYVRDRTTGRCVQPGDCRQKPVCPPNEWFNGCGECPATCQNPNPICPAICRPLGHCQCVKGYARGWNGTCIPVGDCPSNG